MDKNKTFASKSSNVKRPSTVTGATSSRRAVTGAKPVSRAKVNKNATIVDNDVTIRQESLPDFDGEYKQIAYGKFLRAMLEDCLVDEKIEREETHMDVQMAQLADRFQKTMDQLDKTSRRLKDISFVVEQKRLLDLKSQDCSKFYDMTEKSNVQDTMKDLINTEQACLDRLETKGVDFGHDKDSGHKQLLDAVTEAIDGLEHIKKHSNLDSSKFKEYARSEDNLKNMERDRFDLDSLKSEFEAKFPKFSERLLKEASEKIALMMDDDNDDEED